MPQKLGIIDASTLRTPIFAIEMEGFRMATPMAGDQHGYRPASRAKHPDKPNDTP